MLFPIIKSQEGNGIVYLFTELTKYTYRKIHVRYCLQDTERNI